MYSLEQRMKDVKLYIRYDFYEYKVIRDLSTWHLTDITLVCPIHTAIAGIPSCSKVQIRNVFWKA